MLSLYQHLVTGNKLCRHTLSVKNTYSSLCGSLGKRILIDMLFFKCRSGLQNHMMLSQHLLKLRILVISNS